MSAFDSDGENRHDCTADVDARTRRAVTEPLTVLPDLGEARGAPGLFKVVSHTGETYLVDLFEETCECPDHRHREARCKHIRRCAVATGKEPVPLGVERDALDATLGYHAPGTVRVPATDGGRPVADGGDADAGDRPDDCACRADVDLPCWPCYREGFDRPAGDSGGDGGDDREEVRADGGIVEAGDDGQVLGAGETTAADARLDDCPVCGRPACKMSRFPASVDVAERRSDGTTVCTREVSVDVGEGTVQEAFYHHQDR